MSASGTLILNQHTGNYGDEAAGHAMLAQLRQAFSSEPITVTYRRTATGRQPLSGGAASGCEHLEATLTKRDAAFVLRSHVLGRLPARFGKEHRAVATLADHLSTVDRVLVAPSGANIGSYGDVRFLAAVALAVLCGRCPIFHLNTIGPSRKWWFDRIARRVLRQSVLFVRERRSADHLRQQGLPATLGVDSVFSMPDDATTGTRSGLVFVPTMLGRWHPDHSPASIQEKLKREIVPAVARFARERDLGLRLLPHHRGRGDIEGVVSITAELLRSHGVEPEIVEQIDSFVDYERVIRSASLVVAMRYHTLIFAMKNGVPCVTLSYDTKMSDAASYSGCTNTSIELKNVTAERLESLMIHAIESSDLRRRLVSRRPMLDRMARLPVDWLVRNAMVQG